MLEKLVKELSGKTKEEVLNYLKGVNISSDMKNLVFLYLFPRPLLDKELPFRVSKVITSDFLIGKMDPKVVMLIVEAYRTAQYGRFIRHLFHSFLDPNLVNPIISDGREDKCCPICGRKLYSFDNQDNKLISYGSSESRIELCLDCIINLKGSYDIIEMIEPGFLNKYYFRK